MKTWQLILLSIATAICTWQSTAPFGNSAAGFASPLILVLIAIHAKPSRWLFPVIFVVQIPLWLWLHRWVADVAFAGWIGIGLYMSIWTPLFVYLFRRVEANKCVPKVSIIFVAPIIWVGLECMRGIIIFDGYPWYLAGTGIVDSFFAQIAAYGSVWSASFLVVLIATMFATVKQVKPYSWFTLGFFALWLSLFGGYRWGHARPPYQVAVIQTNVPQSNKVAWTWEQQQEDVNNAIQMTYEAVQNANGELRLVIWPETMLPGSGFEIDRFDFAPWDEAFTPFWFWSQKIRELAAEINIPILVGSQTWLDVEVVEGNEHIRVEPKGQFNSAVLVFPDGHTVRYDKSFLTPFGERIPYLEHWPAAQDWIRDKVGVAMLFDLDAGGEPTRFEIPVKQLEHKTVTIRVGTPICFEDTVPSVVRNIVWNKNGEKLVDVLINLSNDGWFGNDEDARLQHIREARMRCIENQTPMIRAANTGVSCYISREGKVTSYAMNGYDIAIRTPNIFYTSINRNLERPLSASVGDKVAWLSLFGSILLIVGTFFKRSKTDVQNTT